MWFTKRDATVPAPFVVAPSGEFEGSDGNWSTFKLDAGTPAQQFRVTISTLAGAVWLPYAPGACDTATGLGATVSQCSSFRGIEPYNGGVSLGFQDNQSSTWHGDGPQQLSLSSELDSGNMSQVYGSLYNIGAVYGSDTVALRAQSSDSQVSASDTPIAGIVDPYDFTLGSFGLAFGDLNVGGTSSPTFMESIANDSSIPSRSWAYTAGAVYESNGVAGSLILGGYDSFRIKGENATFQMPATTEQTLLQVKVKGVAVTYGNNSVGSLTTDSNGQVSPFNAILDFTLPYLYLPDSMVDSLVSTLGLTHDNSSDFYYWNETQPAADISSFAFNLVDTQEGNNQTSITLPYSALNLTASWPLSTSSLNYFPIRKSPSSTYILGRSFFQEAYVIADYERRSFTVAQAAFPTSASSQIVTIFNTTYDQSTGSGEGGGGSNKLSGGAIAGIVIGVVLGVAFIVLAFWLWRRRKTQAGKQNSQVHAAAFESAQEEKLGQEANLGRERSDTILSGGTEASYELGAMPLTNRPSHRRHVSELSSDSERTMQNKLRTPSAIYEMPDTSYLSANEQQNQQWPRNRSSSPAVEAPTRETSTRTATTAPSPIMTATSPAMSSREPLSGVAEAPSPPTSPAPSRQLSVTPSRGVSKFSERSSDMQP